MQPKQLKRVGAPRKREHRLDALCWTVDVSLSGKPTDEWWAAFTRASGRVIPDLQLSGDTISFMASKDENEVAQTVKLIDERIERANRATQ